VGENTRTTYVVVCKNGEILAEPLHFKNSNHNTTTTTMKTSLLALLFAIIFATVSGFGSPSSMALGGVNGGKKLVVGG
jgi:hypothetical protein